MCKLTHCQHKEAHNIQNITYLYVVHEFGRAIAGFQADGRILQDLSPH